MRLAPLQTRDLPGQRLGRLGAVLHPRPDTALAGAHIVAKPADDQTDPFQVRRLNHQLIQRHQQVRPPLGMMHVFRRDLGQPLATHHRLGRQAELPRPGDQADAFQQILQPPLARRAAKHLERQLRRAMTERPQRQVLEHRIGHPPERRRRPLHRLDQRVGRLIRRPAMHPHRHARQVQQLTVGPDPPHPVDGAFAQSNGEAQRVVIIDRLLPALAP